MEAIMEQPLPEGQQPKSSEAIVSEVLSQLNATSRFLHNVGIQSRSEGTSKTIVATCVQQLEETLHFEQEGAATFWQIIESQQQELQMLKQHVQEGEVARNKQLEQMEELKKKQQENEVILHHLLAITQVQYNP